MKKINYILSAIAVAAGLSSCVGDLNVTNPIDPNLTASGQALKSENDYLSLLASVYTGFATSGYEGANGGPSLSGLDGGTSQYLRGRFNLNDLTTDECLCGWNDEGVHDMSYMNWSNDNGLIGSFYYRICHQVSLCNEFIRVASNATINLPNKNLWIAEARALRAFCWLDGIDNFGNMPFADENISVGKYPEQISRADLFSYIESECKDLLAGSDLPAYGQGEYGRADKGLAAMVLAKLYLNAEVYIGEEKYSECADVIKNMGSAYSLHTTSKGKFSAFQELFCADNHLCTDEIIFAVQQDGINTTSYGATNFLIFACVGGKMDPSEFGISSGWGGIRATQQCFETFTSSDLRALFHKGGQNGVENTTLGEFKDGYAFTKFRNVNADGSAAQANGFVDTDFPLFRYADALLMLAECELNGVSCGGLDAINKVRERAGMDKVSKLTEELVLEERLRELCLEGWRRSDLIRFGKYTSDSFLWAWKGQALDGQGVEAHRVLFPLPTSDVNANPNLDQNDGYDL